VNFNHKKYPMRVWKNYAYKFPFQNRSSFSNWSGGKTNFFFGNWDAMSVKMNILQFGVVLASAKAKTFFQPEISEAEKNKAIRICRKFCKIAKRKNDSFSASEAWSEGLNFWIDRAIYAPHAPSFLPSQVFPLTANRQQSAKDNPNHAADNSRLLLRANELMSTWWKTGAVKRGRRMRGRNLTQHLFSLVFRLVFRNCHTVFVVMDSFEVKNEPKQQRVIDSNELVTHCGGVLRMVWWWERSRD